MRLVAATNNQKKLLELRALLEEMGAEVLCLEDIGFTDEIEETGATFAENAMIKARAVHGFCGLAAVADDSGLEVEALGGRPGVYSARYGGDLCGNDVERYEHLLRELEGERNRRARFVSHIACVFEDGRTLDAEGFCEGEILTAPRGEVGFGYDPVFLVAGTGRSMAELSAEEKNRISHRAAALREFAGLLRSMKLME